MFVGIMFVGADVGSRTCWSIGEVRQLCSWEALQLCLDSRTCWLVYFSRALLSLASPPLVRQHTRVQGVGVLLAEGILEEIILPCIARVSPHLQHASSSESAARFLLRVLLPLPFTTLTPLCYAHAASRQP